MELNVKITPKKVVIAIAVLLSPYIIATLIGIGQGVYSIGWHFMHRNQPMVGANQ